MHSILTACPANLTQTHGLHLLKSVPSVWSSSRVPGKKNTDFRVESGECVSLGGGGRESGSSRKLRTKPPGERDAYNRTAS